MPIRDKFPAEYFSTNPLAGSTPHQAFKRLQWGNTHRKTHTFEAPEPMVLLGELAMLVFLGGKSQKYKENELFVAVGNESNYVYLVPIGKGKTPIDFPLNYFRGCQPITQIKRIDYYSEKGGESAYYYHDHEKPYPMLYVNDDHFFLLPAKHRGGRSYAVNDEGIIG